MRLFAASVLFCCAAWGQRAVHVVVAQDGSGDFPTVQNAVDHAGDRVTSGNYSRIVIDIKPGTYHERVRVPADRPRMTLRGSDAKTTIITFKMAAKDAGGTFFSATVDVNGDQFEAENLTFENSLGPGSQAVAVSVHSDKAVFRKCRFLGYQDTLYAASGRQYYKDCYIAGAVDFIFGNAQAVFEDCEVHAVARGYLTAESRTRSDGPEGFVFCKCRLTAEDGVTGVYLGRPWRLYSRVVFIDCWMGPQIAPAGWNNWNKPDSEKLSFYAESGSEGPGAHPESRVSWEKKLTPAELNSFATKTFLGGWDGAI
ncbi:MAG TPA: pectinesterase family protein [Candidatus Limnocylindrales bacterium]|nr:pectinesterase family protein [Candidatus Limnocylindrales bacterium]